MDREIDSSLIGPAQASVFRSSDQIKKDITQLIAENDLIFPKNINIVVEEGRVTLRGRVDNKVASEEAEQAACDVLGVTEVRNELEIGE